MIHILHLKIKSVEILSLADMQLLGFCLLPHILPSCGKKLSQQDTDEGEKSLSGVQRGPSKRKMKVVKASDTDCLMSMIQFKPVIFV